MGEWSAFQGFDSPALYLQMITKSKAVISVFAIVFLASAVSANVNIEPSKYSPAVTPPINNTVDLKVSWSGDKIKYINLDTVIQANNTDTEGLDASLSRPDLVLNPDESKNVTLSINSSSALKPDDFKVYVNSTAKIQFFDDDTGASSSDVEEAVNVVRQELENQSINQSNNTEELRDKIDDLNSTVSDLENELQRDEPDVTTGDVDDLRNQVNELRKSLQNQQNETDQFIKSFKIGHHEDETADKDGGIFSSILDTMFGWIPFI